MATGAPAAPPGAPRALQEPDILSIMAAKLDV
jgi:hypothetical protein